jgi:hypothetical protein
VAWHPTSFRRKLALFQSRWLKINLQPNWDKFWDKWEGQTVGLSHKICKKPRKTDMTACSTRMRSPVRAVYRPLLIAYPTMSYAEPTVPTRSDRHCINRRTGFSDESIAGDHNLRHERLSGAQLPPFLSDVLVGGSHKITLRSSPTI